MLLAEVMHGGVWYPLQIPDEIREEIREFFEVKEYETMDDWMLYREDCPKLHEWMRKHSYRQEVVSVSHSPEVQDKMLAPPALVEQAKQLWNDLKTKSPLPEWDTLSTYTKNVWIKKAKELAA